MPQQELARRVAPVGICAVLLFLLAGFAPSARLGHT
jgi:hypothetical protein